MPEPTPLALSSRLSSEDLLLASIYRWACWLMITTSVAVMIGRILQVRATTGETPMLSANDRSRWCTVRALVENGTYAIDPIIREKHPQTHRRFWSSIDRVRHKGPDGREHDFSSKPTLFPTMVAGEYWIIRQLTGTTLAHDPFFVMRWMLVLTNVLPLILYFVILMRLVEQLATTTLARLYVMAAATWTTYLTTFAVTLNNHLPAAISVLVSVALLHRVWRGVRCGWWCFAGLGLCSSFAVANELPAMAFFVMVGVAALWKSPRLTLTGFVPAAVLVAAGFFGTNYLAHGSWIPAYAHRHDGQLVLRVDATLAGELDQQQLPDALRHAMNSVSISLSDQALVLADKPGARWEIWDRVGQKRFALVRSGAKIEVRFWGNWYDYAGSYWRNKQGVDRGEASRVRYAWHVLFGHHGVFSLTPIWLLAVGGCIMLIRRRQKDWWKFAAMVALLTLVCLAFYIARPVGDRNYGGVTSGFRWMFWFTPLWLLCSAPAADWILRTRTGRVLALLLLLISGISVTYGSANPWIHPWLFDYGSFMGWWHY